MSPESAMEYLSMMDGEIVRADADGRATVGGVSTDGWTPEAVTAWNDGDLLPPYNACRDVLCHIPGRDSGGAGDIYISLQDYLLSAQVAEALTPDDLEELTDRHMVAWGTICDVVASAGARDAAQARWRANNRRVAEQCREADESEE